MASAVGKLRNCTDGDKRRGRLLFDGRHAGNVAVSVSQNIHAVSHMVFFTDFRS